MRPSQNRALQYAAGTLLLPARRLWTRIGERPGPAAFRVLTLHHIRRDEFPLLERLLEYLLEEHGLLTPEEAQRRAYGGQPSRLAIRGRPGRVPYLVTFDDGFQSNFEVARSLLARYAVKAVFFVCPGLIDAAPHEQRALIARYVFDGIDAVALSSDMSLMPWQEIRALRAEGHTIGSHTAYHRRLSTLNEQELIQEVIGSAEMLKDRLREPVSWFATPFGKIESTSRDAYRVVQPTYRLCCSAVRGINDRVHPHALLREHVDFDTPFGYQQFACEGGLDARYAGDRLALWSMLAPE
jgi:peptidoglycan/xylan/chitin deacetylase (PgdA/CDA1 family)